MKYLKIWTALCVCLTCLLGNVKAQNVTLHSIVQNNKGNPVFAALVTSTENTKATYTDKSGNFTIAAPAHATVIINAKGFKLVTLKADAIPTIITLALENEPKFVNLPFRIIDKQDISDAVTVLTPKKYINNDFNTSVEGGINGRVGGLIGTNNIWGMENALVMIDGIRRAYADITLNEVDQITVLKGVNAVALYGSQAAKGVIMITTKQGEADIRKVSLRVNKGIALPKELPSYLNSADYMTLFNEGRRNDGLADLYDATTIQNFSTGNGYRYPSIDYYSPRYLKKYQNATDANAEFSGGNTNARFYSNIGYSNNSTLLKVGEGANEGDNRLSMRGNVDLKLNDNISSSVYVSAIFSDSRRARGNYWGNAASILPNRVTPLIPINLISSSDKATLGIVDASRNVIDGKYLLGGTQQFPTNPIADLYVSGFDINIRRKFQVTNKIDANLKSLLPGLAFHTLFNLDYSNSYLQSISNTYAVYTPTWNATADTLTRLQKIGVDTKPGTQNINNTAQTQNIGFSSWLSYDKTIRGNHNITAMLLGYTSSIVSNDVYQPLTNSHLGLQMGYNFKHKYLADFTGTYVNSTKLPGGNRTGFSPTVSVGWLISSEKFLSTATAIDYLKLTASAGIIKTDLDINNYYLYDNIYQRGSTYSWNDGIQGSNQPATSSYGASPNLSFPQRKEINIGLEGSFFNKLLSVQTTYFNTQMNGVPTQRFSQYPNYFSSFIPYTNYNAQQRSGFDLMINVNKKIGQLEINLGATATYTNSQVTKRDELYLNAYQNRKGQAADAIFGLVSEGFYANQNEINTRPRQLFSEVKPGDIKYKDQNGDKVIDSRDEVVIGRYTSPLNYGINLNVAYKNINLFIQGTGSNGGNGVTTNNYYWVSGDTKYSEVVNNRWTPATAQTATFPRLSSQQNNNNFRMSDFWMYSSARINLSKVQITYNFPDDATGKKFLKNMLVYVSGSNLYTFAKNRKILELNIANTPQFRYFTMGIRASF